MEEEQGVVYYYKNSLGLTIYRFYESGEVVSVVYDEFNMKDFEFLANGATLKSFRKHKLPIDKYNLNGNQIIIEKLREEGLKIERGWLAEDKSLHLNLIDPKGNKIDRIYTKFGLNDFPMIK